MTRINLVDPTLLTDKHLIAEYRELPRIFSLIRKAQDRNEQPNDKRNPTEYTLGKGHVRFFYNKAQWLVKRQQSLIDECLHRGFNIQYTDTSQLADGIGPKWCNDWNPQQFEVDRNVDRINDRGGLRKNI
jgi:hypothetical protein